MASVKLLTEKLVESADVIYFGSSLHSNETPVKKLEVISNNQSNRMVIKTHKNLGDFKFIGIDLDGGIFPYLIQGDKKTKGEHIIDSMRFVEKNLDTIRYLSPNAWESQVRTDGVVYLGQNEFTQIVMFDNPLPFDPEKEFYLVRSPNGKFVPENPLTKISLEEEINIGEWLVFEDRGKITFGDYDPANKKLEELFYGGKFIRKMKIYDSTDGLVLSIIEGGNPVMIDHGNESYSPVWERLKPSQRLLLLHPNIKSFDPLDFFASTYKKIENEKELSREQRSKREYSLIYAKPSEIKIGKWIFNSSINPFSEGISPYFNKHFLEAI